MATTLQDFKSDLFRALANPARIRILEVLRSAGSLTVGDIQQQVGIEAANASQHLSLLRARGIVEARREGTSVWYSVPEPAIFDLLDTARSIFQKQLVAQAEMLST
ncbi:MAG: metalloregulator ArsR/SmtB family transcription factor [bacterium]